MLSGNADVLLDESKAMIQPNRHLNSDLMFLATIWDAKIYGRGSDEVMVRTTSPHLQWREHPWWASGTQVMRAHASQDFCIPNRQNLNQSIEPTKNHSPQEVAIILTSMKTLCDIIIMLHRHFAQRVLRMVSNTGFRTNPSAARA